jgi:hypothetical protein
MSNSGPEATNAHKGCVMAAPFDDNAATPAQSRLGVTVPDGAAQSWHHALTGVVESGKLRHSAARVVGAW